MNDRYIIEKVYKQNKSGTAKIFWGWGVLDSATRKLVLVERGKDKIHEIYERKYAAQESANYFNKKIEDSRE